jgi:ribonuclease HI
MAGWGAVIFRYESPSGIGEVPEFVLHAPVVVQQWDHRWLGARDETNNTAELTAIGEVMHWLLEEAPDHGAAPVHLRYDSIYAANIARGIWEPKSNEELAEAVRALTAKGDGEAHTDVRMGARPQRQS